MTSWITALGHLGRWKYDHIMLAPSLNGGPGDAKDIMLVRLTTVNKTFGGNEDFIWSPTVKRSYIPLKEIRNAICNKHQHRSICIWYWNRKNSQLTEYNKGYDLQPALTKKPNWPVANETDGYESDKQDIVVWNGTAGVNQRPEWSYSCRRYRWAKTVKLFCFGRRLMVPCNYFSCYMIVIPGTSKISPVINK